MRKQKILNKSKYYGLVGEKFTFLFLYYCSREDINLASCLPINFSKIKETAMKKELSDYSINNPIKFENDSISIDFLEEEYIFNAIKNNNWQSQKFLSHFAIDEVWFYKWSEHDLKLCKGIYVEPTEGEKEILLKKSYDYLKELKLQLKNIEKKKARWPLEMRIKRVNPVRLNSSIYLISNGKRRYPDFRISLMNGAHESWEAWAEVKTHYPQSLETIKHAEDYHEKKEYLEYLENILKEGENEKVFEEEIKELREEIRELREEIKYGRPIYETLIRKTIEKYSSYSFQEKTFWNYSKKSEPEPEFPFVDGVIFIHDNVKYETPFYFYKNEEGLIPRIFPIVGAEDFYHLLHKVDEKHSTKFTEFYKRFMINSQKFIRNDYHDFRKEMTKFVPSQLFLF